MESGQQAGEMTKGTVAVLDQHGLLTTRSVAQGLAQRAKVTHGGEVDFRRGQCVAVGLQGGRLQQAQATQVQLAPGMLIRQVRR